MQNSRRQKKKTMANKSARRSIINHPLKETNLLKLIQKQY